MSVESADDNPLVSWSDEQVLEAIDLRMAEADDRRLSDLLERQDSDALNNDEQLELNSLIWGQKAGLLTKEYALREAVRRGLRNA